MAYVWTDDEDDEDPGQQQQAPPEPPPALRKHLKSLEKKLKDLEAEKAVWSAKARTTAVADVVKAQGYDPKIADLIPSTVDGEAAIVAWLGERSSVFAKVSTSDSEGESDVDEVDPETMQAFNVMQNVSGSAQPASKLKDLEARIKSVKSTEELDDIMRSLGAKI